ncbi:MAG: hypothetical protein FJ146_10720 [Deltaproteobacteria bacterium]|nr:hypothetical protein [Deltaproteobacteria bacterium]
MALPTEPTEVRHRFLVPVADLWPTTLQSFAYALSIPNSEVTAIHVTEESATKADFQKEWDSYVAKYPLLKGVKLRVIESPYRSLIGPLLSAIDDTRDTERGVVVSVVLAEFIPEHWWENFLHNQTALRLKAALLFRPGVVVISVPTQMRSRQTAAATKARDVTQQTPILGVSLNKTSDFAK